MVDFDAANAHDVLVQGYMVSKHLADRGGEQHDFLLSSWLNRSTSATMQKALLAASGFHASCEFPSINTGKTLYFRGVPYIAFGKRRY